MRPDNIATNYDHHHKASRKRRVRFEQQDGDNDDESGDITRPTKRRIIHLTARPKSSLMTVEEKTVLYMQPSDTRETASDVLRLMQDCRQAMMVPPCDSSSSSNSIDEKNDPSKVSFGQYAEALAVTFQLCVDVPYDLDNNSTASSGDCDNNHTGSEKPQQPSWNIRTSHSVAQLAAWATYHTATRGVESKILPGLYHVRQERRRKAIQAVLDAQTRLKALKRHKQTIISKDGELDPEQHISISYKALSHSAKEFASAMAVVDGRQALNEYLAMEHSAKLQQENIMMKASQQGVSTTPAKALQLERQRQVTPDPPTEKQRHHLSRLQERKAG